MLKQLDPIHSAHFQIRQDQIVAMLFGKLDSGLAGGRCRDIVPLAGENHLEDFTLRLFVIYYQYALARDKPYGRELGRNPTSRRLLSWFVVLRRQRYPKRCPAALH